MKNTFVIYSLAILFAAQGCSRQNSDSKTGDMQPVKNSFTTADAALEQTKKNLNLILNENQKKIFGLKSDDEIKGLSKVMGLPISYLNFNQLKDSNVKFNDEGFIYGLGSNNTSKICVTIAKSGNEWMQSSVGLKNYVLALNRNPKATRLVDVPGLEMSFLEVADPNGKAIYAPVNDYSQARISNRSTYTKAQLLPLLEGYRLSLEKKFGKDFSAGNLEK